MKTKLILAAIMIIAQLLVPGYMIYQRENTLENGETYLFKTAPVDPFDAFRGRYVALRFDQETLPIEHDNEFKRGQTVYLTLTKDNKGITKVSSPSLTKPDSGEYLKVRNRYYYKSKLTVDLPFDRFYMDEYSAPEAEKLYRDINRWQRDEKKDNRECYAKVKILNGFAVLEDLIIDGKGIKEVLKGRSSDHVTQ